MKALSKAAEERYQSGQDLVNDLERCKESATKAAAAAKPGQAVQKAPAPQKPAPAVSAPPVKPASPGVTQPKPTFKPAAPVAKCANSALGGKGCCSRGKRKRREFRKLQRTYYTKPRPGAPGHQHFSGSLRRNVLGRIIFRRTRNHVVGVQSSSLRSKLRKSTSIR